MPFVLIGHSTSRMSRLITGHWPLATDHFYFTMLVQRHAGELAVVLDEVHGDDHDVVFRHAVSREAGEEVIRVPESARDDSGQFLQADADTLGDSNALAGLQVPEGVRNFRTEIASRRRQPGCRDVHSTSPLPLLPRTRAIRPVRASSRMPYGRINSMNASIFRSW